MDTNLIHYNLMIVIKYQFVGISEFADFQFANVKHSSEHA